MIDDESWPFVEEEPGETGGGRKRNKLRVVTPDDEVWREGMDLDRKGLPKKTAGNGALALQNLPVWSGLRFDKFRLTPSLTGAPSVPGFDPPRPGPLDDYTVTYIGHWLSKYEQICLSDANVATAAEVASKAVSRSFHPIREYLEALKWDRVLRLDSWLSEYMGAVQSEFSGLVGSKWMVSAVARVMVPGCQADHMLILEGNQGDGKSTALEALASKEYFADTGLEIGNKDSYQSLRSKWIYEFGELDSMKGREVTRVKNFVSARVDNYRKSYGKGNADYPRQVVFAGTTNETHYLTDHTGNRRFWPVRTGKTGPIRVDKIREDRDQLWAEAFARYMDGERWHIEEKRLVDLAKAEQSLRQHEDVWLAPVAEWLKGPFGKRAALEGTTIANVISSALSMPTKDQDDRHNSRMGKILSMLGFEEKPGRHRPRLYYKPGVVAEETDDET